MTSDRICLITGATSGIGKAAALALAQQGVSLLLVSRKRDKGELLLQEIAAKTNSQIRELYVADLSSQRDIRKLADEIKASHPRIDILINNAGGIFGRRILTVDGIELTFALNHLASFLLANLLMDPLKAAPSARIVNVSSQAHRLGTIRLGDPGLARGYSAVKAYAQSKLANILFTYELSRRLAGTSATVNALHPGSVRTNFGRELPGIAGFVFRHFGFTMRAPEKGAETLIWLATDPDLAGVTGKYFFDRKEIRSSPLSYDVETAKRLWDVSGKMTGLE